MKRTPTFNSPGPTAVILTCFVVSMVFRIGTQGIAMAEAVVSNPIASKESTVQETNVSELITTLQLRNKQLDAREEDLADRLLMLNSVGARVAEQIERLQFAQEKLANTIAIADSASERDLERLTTVYEKMKAKSAADIFQTMELSFAAGFLSRMKPEAAAGILSELPAEVAYSFSVVMAGRNANAPID